MNKHVVALPQYPRWQDIPSEVRGKFAYDNQQQGISPTEIASRHGTTLGTVAGVIHRYKKKHGLLGKKLGRPTKRAAHELIKVQKASRPLPPIENEKLSHDLGKWADAPLDEKKTCVEPKCEDKAVLNKVYCRYHCSIYFRPPKEQDKHILRLPR